MALTSALEVIKGALLRVGVLDPIEAPTAEQTAVCLDALNGLIDTMQTSALSGIGPVEYVASVTGGAVTIGPTGQIDVPRPLLIAGAYCRIAGTDYPVEVIGKQEWDSIDLKALGSTWPDVCWYDDAMPTGTVRFWPIPAGTVEMHLTVTESLQPFATALTSQHLGQGLKRALALALALEVSPIFGMQPTPQLLRDAANAMRVYKRTRAEVQQLDIINIASVEAQFIAGGQV
jgi:hypothetical protein